MKNVLKPLAKSVLTSLGSAAASVPDAAIHKKILGSGHPRMSVSRPSYLAPRMTALIISN